MSMVSIQLVGVVLILLGIVLFLAFYVIFKISKSPRIRAIICILLLAVVLLILLGLSFIINR